MDFEFEHSKVVILPEDDQLVNPQTLVTTKTSTLPTPEVYYRPDGEILPPGLFFVEEEFEEYTTPGTPFHFGTGLCLYPYTPRFTAPFDLAYFQVPVDSLGHLLGQ